MQKSQGGAQFLNTMLNVCSNRHEKSLATCKLYLHLPRPRNLYRYERRTGRAPSFAFFATWARDDTRNSIFCKSLKLVSPCRFVLAFHLCPRLLFHVAQATAYQAVRYTAEIKQIDQWFPNFHEPWPPSKDSGEYFIHRGT